MKNLLRSLLGFTLAFGLLSGFVQIFDIGASVYAAPAVWYVSGDGTCGGNTPCYTTVQAAVDVASSGDEIRIADGVYTSNASAVVTLDKSLTLKGGYASDFSARELNNYTSLLDGELSRRVISLDSSGLEVTLDGLHIFRGSNDSSSGGGIRDYTGNNILYIQNCQIYQNVANISGGGVYIGDGTDATLTTSAIYSNTAEGGDGGGIAVAQNGALTMTSNQVYGNLVDYDASGGGVAIGAYRIAQLSFNYVYGNRAGEHGGGISVDSSTVITASYNAIRDNEAGIQGTAYGGGVYLYKTAGATFTGNTLSSNVIAGRGGGIGVNDSAQVLLSGNTLLGNHVTQYDGGGIYVTQSPGTVLENNVVAQNAALSGGGVYVSSSANSTLSGLSVYGNTATEDGGGVYVSGSNGVLLERSRIYANTVSEAVPTVALGGGVAIVSSADVQVVNTVIADNTLVGQYGAGVVVRGGETVSASAGLTHTTIARNTDSGVYADYSTVALLNTILVSHTVGAYADTNGAISLEATLWGADAWANLTDYDGFGPVLTGTLNYTGTPDFLSDMAGDYHIGMASAALDKATTSETAVDIDGEMRPFGLASDLGADELVYGLEISKSAPATALPRELITYTLTITNSSALTITNVVITDVLPTGATYRDGGTLVLGDVISWTLTDMGGGAVVTRQFAVTATDTIVNARYGVLCAEGAAAQGTPVTTMVTSRIYLPVLLQGYGL